MMEGDIICVNIPDNQYDSLVRKIVKYSIISLPFTIDRMNQIERYGTVEGNKKRIANIFKGKLAETLFAYFCTKNDLKVDFDSCTTPFYSIDKRDFLYNGTEYDIKNNFIYHSGDTYQAYCKLPALIPNRYPDDQWDSRLSPHIAKDVGYIFSFLKGADLILGNRGDNFLTVNIAEKQGELLNRLYKKYRGMPQTEKPFESDWFWNEMNQRGPTHFFELRFRPKLVIGGVANSQNWDVFKDVGPNAPDNYKSEPIANWYKKRGRKNSIKFHNGEIWGTITNRTAPIQFLKPITDIFPTLKTKINCGRFLH